MSFLWYFFMENHEEDYGNDRGRERGGGEGALLRREATLPSVFSQTSPCFQLHDQLPPAWQEGEGEGDAVRLTRSGNLSREGAMHEHGPAARERPAHSHARSCSATYRNRQCDQGHTHVQRSSDPQLGRGIT